MYRCELVLKNKSEWIAYVKSLINSGTNKPVDELLDEILSFHFEFGGISILQ